MSHQIDPYLRWLDAYQDLKHQMIDVLADVDLSHVIEGSPSLGELCREHGEIEQSYLDSFRTYKLSFDYKHPDPDIAGSTEALSDWYTELDEEFKAVLEAFKAEDLESTSIDRDGWSVSIRENLGIYKEAVVIFAAKAWIHLLAMGKTLPKQWRDWL
jgi:hypothetical protein